MVTAVVQEAGKELVIGNEERCRVASIVEELFCTNKACLGRKVVGLDQKRCMCLAQVRLYCLAKAS